MSAVFSQPVFAKIIDTEGRPLRLEITTPEEGLIAINRHGLGEFRINAIEWQIAIGKLQEAIRDPTPENREVARDALAQLARQSTPRLDR